MGNSKVVDIDMFPGDLEFRVFTSDEIKRLSVVRIVTGLTFNVLGHPLPGGLYDSALGTYGRLKHPCTTCYNMNACPGHMGHIELNSLCYNPFFIKTVHKMLQVFCLKCHRLQFQDYVLHILVLQLCLIDAGYIIEAQELEIFKSDNALQKMDNAVTLENGARVHPRIAEIRALLLKALDSELPENTKTSNAIRDAIIHNALQRPTNVKCVHCNTRLRSVRYQHRKLVFFMNVAELKSKVSGVEGTVGQNKIILADECRSFLRAVYKEHPNLVQLLFPILKLSNIEEDEDHSPVDIFFMDIIPVTPSKARPTNVVNDHIVEHPQTAIYRSILQNNQVVRVIVAHIKGQMEDISDEARQVFETAPGDTPYEKLYNICQELQNSIDLLLDVSTNKLAAVTSQGLKQILEKKDGLLRKHMMGKRVNFAARTVITPDPNINVDEVGIPDTFARKLSFPMPVTPWNVSELRRMVINGPNTYPGANFIQDDNGYTTIIPSDSAAKRQSMAKLLLSNTKSGTKIVHRHLLNGDVVLLNRQPSLHKPSIMAHKVRILSGEKTFRLHYSNCKAYNADFDGDEMNAHYPQSEVARSEAFNLVNVANNYLVPKDGTPLGGLIQDHIISGVKLSIRGRFFNREDYQQLVFQGLSHMKTKIKLLRPTIIKPATLWSGKQVLSTIILNLIPKGYPLINLISFAKIPSKQWKVSSNMLPHFVMDLQEPDMCESEVRIVNGELLAGVLDKQQYGATTYGFIHCMYELYGGEVSTSVLTAFTKVFTYFLQREGFSLGVKDILLTADADNIRRTLIKECRAIGNKTMTEALDLPAELPLDELVNKIEETYANDPTSRRTVDRKYKSILDSYTNDINKACVPNGLINKFPQNNLQLMVLSGAKGSVVNTMQISCLLGQIELEGKRPPLMISGKSLPSFTAFETSPKSGGFVDGRFMTGIKPQDFFFHCMAGREGLIDTAVKTSRSGYLQRCLIKHLEGLTVNYDLTVRDSDNCVVQYLYGEDGLDILKSKFFRWKQAPQFFIKNADVVLRPNEIEIVKDEEALHKVMRYNKSIRNWLKQKKVGKKPTSPFTAFSRNILRTMEVEDTKLLKVHPKRGRRRLDEKIVKMWNKASDADKDIYYKKCRSCPDPVTAAFKQDLYYGSVSEKVKKIIDEFHSADPKAQSVLADVMYLKNMKGLAAPGDPVGLLAAQSIGEPSTQMTLNTFHFAGRGEMNVTLGIPRLREILMLASSKIKTPTMDVPLNPGHRQAADKLRVNLNYVTLANILEYVNIQIKLVLQPERVYQYKLHFHFLPREFYRDQFCVRPKKILKYVATQFFKRLYVALIKSARSKTIVVDVGDKEKDKSDENIDNIDDECDYEISGGTKSKQKAPGVENAENGVDTSDGEATQNEDDDATGIKLKTRKQDETEYDDPDDVEEIDDTEGEEDAEKANDAVVNEVTDSEGENSSGKETVQKLFNNEMICDYTCDEENHLWCEITFNMKNYKKPLISSVLRELAYKSVLHEVPNIKRAIIIKDDDNNDSLKTDGNNIVEMFKHGKILNLNRLYTNDIHAIANTYGIEAAAQVIMKEIFNVFKVYGIEVDRRHLSLIADYMTFDGTFQPMSRKGMQYSASPLQQMSFESCLQFLKNAANSGRTDHLNSPTSRLMVGLPVKNGTGAFDLLTKIC